MSRVIRIGGLVPGNADLFFPLSDLPPRGWLHDREAQRRAPDVRLAHILRAALELGAVVATRVQRGKAGLLAEGGTYTCWLDPTQLPEILAAARLISAG